MCLALCTFQVQGVKRKALVTPLALPEPKRQCTLFPPTQLPKRTRLNLISERKWESNHEFERLFQNFLRECSHPSSQNSDFLQRAEEIAISVIQALTFQCAFCDNNYCNGLDCVIKKKDRGCFNCGEKCWGICKYSVSKYICTFPNCLAVVDPKKKKSLEGGRCERCSGTSWRASGKLEFDRLNEALKWNSDKPCVCILCLDYRETAKDCFGKCQSRGPRKRIRCLLIKASRWDGCDFGDAFAKYYGSRIRATAFLAAMNEVLQIDPSGRKLVAPQGPL